MTNLVHKSSFHGHVANSEQEKLSFIARSPDIFERPNHRLKQIPFHFIYKVFGF